MRGDPSKRYQHKDINHAILSGDIWRYCYPWHGQPQANYLGPNTEIIRFEHLEEDWQRVIGGLPLPITNVSRKDRNGVNIELSAAAKSAIQRRWGADFELLHYEK
jgi:hypothetical protein